MTIPSRVLSSSYMNWAKTQSHTKYNLATSGLKHYPLSELPLDWSQLAISGPSYYGYPALQAELAGKNGVDPSCVMAATGTSMANHLAMAAAFEPGDEVLIEEPTYELLTDTAGYLQANIRRFPRRFETGYALDPAEVERALTPRTKLIVVTNLHNPSSNYTEAAILRQVGELARSVGAHVLVDEVYLDAMFDQAPSSAFHLGPEFITTSSLTKVYGLSGLRCGWVLAEPEMCRRIWRMNDLFGVIPSHTAELLSIVALQHLPRVAAWAKQILDQNRTALNEFLSGSSQIRAAKLEAGTVVFPKTMVPVEPFCAYLRETYEASVVPGYFFGEGDHFRIGIGGDPEMTREGLSRLREALERYPHSA